MGLFAIDARGIWESDEGRYTAVAVEMLRSGDLLTPRLDLDEPHLTKPPLTYWSVAASFALFGVGELTARLPNLLAFVLTVLVVLRIGRHLAPVAPWLPALVYATMPVTVLGANVVTTDTLLTLFEALAVLCWLEHASQKSGSVTELFSGFSGDGQKIGKTIPSPTPIFWMWVAFGLGFLTKGPPALLPLLAIAAFTGLRGEPLRPLFPWSGVLAFALVGLGWYAWLVARDPALAGYFVGDEIVARIASDAHDRNPEWYAPFTVYLPVLLAGLLPWGLAALRELAAARRWLAPAGWRARFDAEPAAAFLALWFALPLLVFSLSRSRQPGYVLPLLLPLALMLGRALAPRLDLGRWRWRALLMLAIALPLATKAWLAGWPYYKDSRGLAAHVAAEFAPTVDDRIVFFGRWPQWGLRVYQPARIAWREVDEPLCDALAPPGRRSLVITWTKRPADLGVALAACGRGPARRLAPYRDMALHAIE